MDSTNLITKFVLVSMIICMCLSATERGWQTWENWSQSAPGVMVRKRVLHSEAPCPSKFQGRTDTNPIKTTQTSTSSAVATQTTRYPSASSTVATQTTQDLGTRPTVVGDGLVFVSMTGGFEHPAGDPIPFNDITTTRGDGWSRTTHSFNIREAAGLYFVALSVGAHRQPVNYLLNLSGRPFGGITRTSMVYGNTQDVLSHDFLIHLYAADSLHVSSAYRTASWHNQRETSLSIFSITHTMLDETTAFCVARNHTIAGYTEPVPFNTYLYNAGRHYNPLNHTYTTPSAGIYYFSFSVGLNAHSTAGFVLYKNQEAYVKIVRKSTRHNGTDTIGRAVMMRLEQGDQIYMVNEAGQTARSSPMMEICFSGFKYQPKHGNMVAWSVARTSSQGSGNVEYPVVLVNEGNVWRASSNTAVIPRQGYYFIHIGAGVASTEWKYLWLYVNNSGQFLVMQSQTDARTDTITRSGILYLSVGDVVRVQAYSQVYSDNLMQTIFMGFLL